MGIKHTLKRMENAVGIKKHNKILLAIDEFIEDTMRISLRPVKFFLQRKMRGFDDTDLWSLDYTIAKFILPRLIEYKNSCPCIPTSMYPPYNGRPYSDSDRDQAELKWNKILDDMIDGFKIRVSDEYNVYDENQYKKVDKAFKLLSKYHSSLWW